MMIAVCLVCACATSARAWLYDSGNRLAVFSPSPLWLGAEYGETIGFSASLLYTSNSIAGVAWRESGRLAYFDCTRLDPRAERGIIPSTAFVASCRTAAEPRGPWTTRRDVVFPAGAFAE